MSYACYCRRRFLVSAFGRAPAGPPICALSAPTTPIESRKSEHDSRCGISLSSRPWWPTDARRRRASRKGSLKNPPRAPQCAVAPARALTPVGPGTTRHARIRLRSVALNLIVNFESARRGSYSYVIALKTLSSQRLNEQARARRAARPRQSGVRRKFTSWGQTCQISQRCL